jgi:glycosyltransferase involved in cell wall biosynthesis
MKILVLSGHAPSPQARQAGQKTSYYICEFLARKHEVHLLSFVNEDEAQSVRPEYMAIFRSCDFIPVTNWTRLKGVLTAPRLPLSVGARSAEHFRRKLKGMLKRGSYDVAILDHTAMWQYRDMLDSVALVGGSAHDVLSQLWARKAAMAGQSVWGWLWNKEYERVQNWERLALMKLDFVSPHSEKDGQLLSTLGPRVVQCPIQPWHTPTPNLNSTGKAREPLSVVFWGAMNRSENVDAIRFALSDIFPKIHAQVPECCLYVAGSHSDSLHELKVSRAVNVVTTGYVEDIYGFLSRMQVALLPLRMGAGIKVKVLECMAAGVAVVTTPVGIEGVGGLHGKHYMLGQSPDELASHVVRLLNSPVECEALGARAQELVRSEHQFVASMEKFCSFLTEMREHKRVKVA